MTGFEPVTSSLPRKCSTPELHRQLKSGRRDSNPRPSAWKANALSTELLPQTFRSFSNKDYHNRNSHVTGQPPNLITSNLFWWAVMDSNHRRRKPAELQSAPFVHSGNYPSETFGGLKQVNPPIISLSLLSDSNQRPRDYKSRALAN